MFINIEQTAFLNIIVVFGIFGWIRDRLTGGTKEDRQAGLDKIAKPIEHQRKFAAAGRAAATKSRAGEATERAPRRRIKKAISRNQESRGAYRRRTSGGR